MSASLNKVRALRAVVCAIALLPIGLIHADPPGLMRYQARLTGSGGNPLAGSHSLVFKIYDDETAGSILWTEGPITKVLQSGNLDILLGEMVPLASSIVTDPGRWLEIDVDGVVLAPRHRLSSVPYSLLSDRLGTKTLPEIISDNDNRYPRLNNANTFTGNQNFNGDVHTTGRGEFNASTGDHALKATQAGSGAGVHGAASDSSGVGVRGQSTAANGGEGVKGDASGAGGTGVKGEAMGSQGTGVHGAASDASGVGVRGQSTAANGGEGVKGDASGSGGTGVKGEAMGAQGTGVHGAASDASGVGVRGQSTAANGGEGVKGDASGSGGTGVKGEAMGTQGTGVHGAASDASGVGVRGQSTAVNGGEGVKGDASGSGGTGVKGEAMGAQGTGVHGAASDASGVGVRGQSTAANGGEGVKGDASGSGGTGVKGEAMGTQGTGVHGAASDASGVGVRGQSTASTGGAGVKGDASGAGGTGVKGEAMGAQGTGVHGAASDGTGVGVRGQSTASTGGAGVKGDAAGQGGIGVKGEAMGAQGAGVQGVAFDTSGVGVRGQSDTGLGGAGVKGDAIGVGGTGVTGEAIGAMGVGVKGSAITTTGIGGLFDNSGGGKILSGQVGGVEVFSVESSGVIEASSLILTNQAIAHQMVSSASGGTAPLLVSSPTLVGNLNCDMLDGMDSTSFAPGTGSGTYLSKAGDTMTGPLLLPTNGLMAGAGQFSLSGGNVGVGTSTPASKLEVIGTSAATTFSSAGSGQPVQIAAPAGTATGAGVQIAGGIASGSGGAGGGVLIGGGGATGPGGTGGHIILSPGSGATQGRVGVGTLTPAALFDVNGEARATQVTTPLLTSSSPGVTVEVTGPSGAGTGSHVQIKGGNASNPGGVGGNILIQGGISTGGGGAGGNIILSPGAGATGGRVGVGTFAPAAPLDVNGEARALQFAAPLFTSPGASETVVVASPDGSGSGGLVQIKGGNASNPGAVGGRILISGGVATGGGGAGGDILLQPGGGTIPGRVGIGTISPLALLDVNGEARATQVTTTLLSTPDPGLPLEIHGPQGTGSGGAIEIAGGDATAGGPAQAGSVNIMGGNTTMGTGFGGNIVFLPGNGGVPGNVGINTSQPEVDLHLLGRNDKATIRIENLDTDGPSSPATLELSATALDPAAFWIIRTGHEGPGASFASGLEFHNAVSVESALVLEKNGNVGIGTPDPTQILTVKQNSSTDPIADAWTVYSSRRWKTNIDTLEGALERVRRLRGVSFDWKADGRHDIGLIAEEVGEVVPEVVAFEPNGTDASSVDYARLVALLIEAVKEQQAEIDELKELIKRRR